MEDYSIVLKQYLAEARQTRGLYEVYMKDELQTKLNNWPIQFSLQ